MRITCLRFLFCLLLSALGLTLGCEGKPEPYRTTRPLPSHRMPPPPTSEKEKPAVPEK
jgi:hypothetical protein